MIEPRSHRGDGGEVGEIGTHERELTERVELTLRDGRVDPRAIGFSRRSLHTARLRGPWGRRKRWDYWCVTTREGALQITVADLDYFGLVDVSFIDFETKKITSAPWVAPLGLGVSLGEKVGDEVSVITPVSRVSIRSVGGGTDIAVRTLPGRMRANVHVEQGGETLDVVVPWSERRFQLTSKHVARPAAGIIHAQGRRYDVSPTTSGFGCLDFGRGVWPYKTTWNWGAGAGFTRRGKRIGLQLGGKWTVGTGSTENGIFVDGRLHKIGEELAWSYDVRAPERPWRVHGAGVDVTLFPRVPRRARIELGIASSAMCLAFGTWSGTVHAFGERHEVRDLVGWAEEHRARW